MGFWSGLGIAISSGISTLSSAICNSVSAIGSSLSSFANGAGTIIASAITTLNPVAQAISKFANVFLQALGILKPAEKIEEMGERALQAASQGHTMDKFENFNDYMKSLRDFQIDPEISATRSSAEKLMAGMGISTVGLEDKFNVPRGSLNTMWLLPMSNPDYFTPERMQGLVAAGRLGSDIYAYLEKSLSGGDSRTFEKSLETGSTGKPMSESELDKLYDALDSARENWADIAKHIQQNGSA